MSNKNNNIIRNLGVTIAVFALIIGVGFKLNLSSNMHMTLQYLKPESQEVGNIEVLPDEVIPGGDLIGVKIISDGIYVVGSGEVETLEGKINPCRHKILKGDRIYEINQRTIHSKEELREVIEDTTSEEILIGFLRDGEKKEVSIKPVYSKAEQTYRLGLWVKDGIQGIGTITYIDPNTNRFGALGHGISDGETKTLIPIKKGEIIPAEITTITKGQRGDPGQLSGAIEYNKDTVLGSVSNNTSIGIYGELNDRGVEGINQKAMPIAKQGEIVEGPATILTTLVNKEIESYQIIIEKVSHYSSEPAKGMTIKVIDDRLLDITNGIVQGMSGSPIIQNGKLVGAVTHVFINDPSRGYGIFIENMLNVAQETGE